MYDEEPITHKITERLTQVTNGVPKNLDKLQTQTAHAVALKNQAEKKMKSFLKTADAISSAAVVLSVVLDLADLFKKSGEHHYMKKIVGEYYVLYSA
jgi:L-lactate permease